jgi:hypothetical protein
MIWRERMFKQTRLYWCKGYRNGINIDVCIVATDAGKAESVFEEKYCRRPTSIEEIGVNSEKVPGLYEKITGSGGHRPGSVEA